MEHKTKPARPKPAPESSSSVQHLDSRQTPLANGQMVRRVRERPQMLTATDVQALQRSVGNRAVQGLLSRTQTNRPQPLLIQPKLKVGPAGDRYEEEAERVSATVMRQISDPVHKSPRGQGAERNQKSSQPLVSVQRQHDEEEEGDEGAVQLQRKAFTNGKESSYGGSLDAGTEQSIQRAKGGGKRLSGSVRSHMEGAFGSDFGAVRIHADAHANQLSRSLDARAFTTGKDIFFAQGQYKPASARGQKLIAHELTHVVQQTGKVQTSRIQRSQHTKSKLNSAQTKQGESAPIVDQQSASQLPDIQKYSPDGVIQRDVGFELQTGWGIRERGGWRLGGRKHRRYRRQEVVRDYGAFQFTADEANTNLGAEIEFVIKHIPEDAGVDYLDNVMTHLENLAASLNAFKDRDKFTLNKATGLDADKNVEIFPKIKQHGDMQANPQLTGGIRQDRITQLFQDLSHTHGAHSKARSDLVATGGGGGLGNAATAVANLTFQGGAASDKLKGLVALLVNYLRMGRKDMGNGMENPTLNYGKASLTLLARTDFHRMFTELPDPEQTYYNTHPKEFRDMVLTAAGGLDKDADVLERKIHNKRVKLSRNRWLRHIAMDQDLLKKTTDKRLFGYGELGAKTDDVGPGKNEKGIIMEFRTMRKAIKYDQWKPMAIRAWNYLSALNQ